MCKVLKIVIFATLAFSPAFGAEAKKEIIAPHPTLKEFITHLKGYDFSIKGFYTNLSTGKKYRWELKGNRVRKINIENGHALCEYFFYSPNENKWQRRPDLTKSC